jgi:hypothetical protein
MAKKSTIAAVLLLVVSGMLFADEVSTAKVDTDVLGKAYAESYINDKSPVSWKNYSTGKQIRDMGRRLGAEIKYQAEVNKTDFPYSSGSPDFKYRAARIFPGDKQGADVIYINKNAIVNTIQNIQRVVSGYIESAYGIPMEQADEIAVKVCYWNTNHYQHRVVEVFSNKTKIIGLARSYKNWAGKTRIVIPFKLIQETAPNAVEPTAPVKEVEAPTPAPEPETTPVVPEPASVPKASGISPIAIALLVLLGIAIIVLIVSLVVIANKKKRNNQ